MVCQTIKTAARVCRFCGRDVEPIAIPAKTRMLRPAAPPTRATPEPIAPPIDPDRWQPDQSDYWDTDPFGRHQLRLFSRGQPTQLVKDGTNVSKDPIEGVVCW